MWKHHKYIFFPDVGKCKEAKNVLLLLIVHAFQKKNFEHHSHREQIEHKGKLYAHHDLSETKSYGKCRENISL